MKKELFLVGAFLFFAACGTDQHKAEEIDTAMESKGEVTGGEKVGVKDGKMIVQKKVLMAEELRELQVNVYETEDRVYGNRKFGSQGMYGVLKGCRQKLAMKEHGGTGTLRWIEPLERVTDKEEEFTIGLDEKNELVGVSEEFLKDRIERFRKYRQILQKREDEFREKIDICEAELASKQYDMKNKEKDQPHFGEFTISFPYTFVEPPRVSASG